MQWSLKTTDWSETRIVAYKLDFTKDVSPSEPNDIL